MRALPPALLLLASMEAAAPFLGDKASMVLIASRYPV
jgi:hypothetical protein